MVTHSDHPFCAWNIVVVYSGDQLCIIDPSIDRTPNKNIRNKNNTMFNMYLTLCLSIWGGT